MELAPFIEEGTLYKKLELKKPHAGSLLFTAQNALAVDGVAISLLHCASSPLDLLWPVGNVRAQMPSYVGISGSASDANFAESRVQQCCSPENQGEISAGGVLIPNQAIAGKKITDGLAHTLLVGECSDALRDANGIAQRIDGGFPNSWLTGTVASGIPPRYTPGSIAPAAWNITTIRYAINTPNYTQAGIHSNRGANNPLNSTHPLGINSLFADGGVRFLSEELQVRILKESATRDDGSAHTNP